MGISRYIALTYPEALLLGAALAYVYWRFVKGRNAWRTAAVLVAALALCYPVVLHHTKALDLYVLVDRSRSIPAEGRAKEKEILDLVARNLKPGDRLAVVSFNEKAHIEQAPSAETIVPQSFQIPYSEDASDLSEGVQTVLGLVDENRLSRVLVLSDGEYTGSDPLREAQVARQKKVQLHYRDLKRAEVFNLMVSEVNTPDKLLENEPFRVDFNVRSSVPTPGRYRVVRDGQVIGRNRNDGWRDYQFEAGSNRISFSDSLKVTGIHGYRIEVEATPKDKEAVLADNTAERFVSIVGEQPLLLVNNTGSPDNISAVLSAGGIKTHIVNISGYRLTDNQLSGYKGVILNNVAAVKMTVRQLENLRNFVVEEGGGLLISGGNNSYAQGGYYRTALEPILPVSLEDRKQSKKIATAFSIVMDRSGSMAMRTPSGETKISLADHAAAECVALMTPADSVSVIPVDSQAHIAVPQTDVTNPDAICSEIKRVESMGGGIFVYTGLVAAGSEIIKAKQLNKHVLLFADAADSEEPGDYKKLLEDFTEAGITVSVVGLGTEQDSDAEFLKDVARRGNGQVYFTQDASQLVQFFTADTMTYSRKSFVEEPAPMKIRGAAFTISPEQKWQDFSCAGYNLLFSKENADVAIITADSDSAPVLAFWQKGLGRVCSLALDTDGQFAGTGNFGDIMLSAARWVMGSEVFDNLQIRTRSEGINGTVTMDVSDEERRNMGEAKLTVLTPKGRTITKPLTFESFNRLSASVKMEETGCYRGIVQIGDKTYRTGPLSLPVSPEFAYERGPSAGKRTLAEMAAMTGGSETMDVRNLFARTERVSVRAPLVVPFLILLLALIVIEIAEQRFAMLAAMQVGMARLGAWAKNRRFVRPRQEEVPVSTGARTKPLRRRKRPRGVAPDSAAPPPTEPASEEAPQGQPPPEEPPRDGGLDYLAKSKSRASQALRRRAK